MRKLYSLNLMVVGVGVGLLLLSLAPASASSANISHSYKLTGSITDGSLVSLDAKRSDYIQAANSSNAQRLLGVTVAANDSLLEVDPGSQTKQVATSGTVSALVSNLNGSIGVGDQISVSPFDGVGMKALPGTRVIGLAQTAFNANSADVTSQEVTDKSGKTVGIMIGYSRVAIAVGTAPTTVTDNLNALQRLSKSLTGHVVSTGRVIVSLIIALVAVTALIPLIYASIYGGIISIGRNPLAKYAVLRTMTSVLGVAILTSGVAILTIYLLLR